jgi:purine-binding chemotaxis protein CheW
VETLIPSAVAGSPDGKLTVLLVEVGEMPCGIPAAHVVELHAMVATVALPGAPPGVDGAIDVRGSITGVLDVRTRLGLPRRRARTTDHLVVCRVGDRTVALRVDRAVDLIEIAPDSITSAEDLPYGPHVRGVARLMDGLMVVYDLASFLSAHEATALDEALDHAATATASCGNGGQDGHR